MKKPELEKALVFCAYLTENDAPVLPKPLQYENENGQMVNGSIMHQFVDEWIADFVEMRSVDLAKLAVAANILRIPSLVDVCCAKLALEQDFTDSIVISLQSKIDEFRQPYVSLYR